MLLAIDIGNTNISAGIFNSDILVHSFRLQSDKLANESEYETLISKEINKCPIKACIIGSVVNELSDTIKNTISNLYGIDSVMVSDNLNFGFKIDTPNPKEAGADRIANIAAVKKLYSLPAIVVDAGTATTFDIADSKGNFSGGIIIPGIKLQLEALSGKTSKLPLIKIKDQNSVIGKNTEENILSGVIRGHVCAIEGLLKECEKELEQKPTVIFTGGFCTLISKYTNMYDEVNPNLTLWGLKFLYDLNC